MDGEKVVRIFLEEGKHSQVAYVHVNTFRIYKYNSVHNNGK